MFLTAPDGCRLAYDDLGDGQPAILFLHGIMMDRSVFAAQIEAFAASRRVVAVDLRGHGASDKPAEGYTFEQYVADLKFMIDALDLSRPVIAGWSMGGALAMAFAAAHPGVAGKLVLIGTTPCLVQRPDWPHAVPAEAAQQLGQALATDYAGAAAAFRQMMFPETDAAPASAHALRVMQQSAPHATSNCMQNIGGADLRSLLGAIRDPVHAICGERDAVCPPDASRYIARTTGGSLSLIPEAGHCAFMTRPTAFKRGDGARAGLIGRPTREEARSALRCAAERHAGRPVLRITALMRIA
jgi:pimeloyl-ACP methyl ester carboxylesterase